MTFTHDLFVSSEVHLPFDVEENKDECTLETIEDYERVPQQSYPQERCEKSKCPGEPHNDGEFEIDDEVYPVLLPAPLLVLHILRKLDTGSRRWLLLQLLG